MCFPTFGIRAFDEIYESKRSYFIAVVSGSLLSFSATHSWQVSRNLNVSTITGFGLSVK